MYTFIEQLYITLVGLGQQIIATILLLIPAVLVFFIGKAIANWLADLFEWSRRKTQGRMNKTGRFLRGLVYYVIFFMTLITVFDILGLEILSNLLKDVVLVIPEFIKWLAIGGGLAVAWEARQEVLLVIKKLIQDIKIED